MTDTVDVATMGSSDAVAKLLESEVDMAGFHFGMESPAPPPGSVFSLLFEEDRFKVMPLLRGQQGLMLATNNPLQIRSIRDLCSIRARFINRQRGSGTRLWFDRLLAEEGLSPFKVRGYAVEEFTHQAIAAVVASGAADVGMGVRAAAEQFGLSFIPLGHEIYFVAARRGLDGHLEGLMAAVKARVSQIAGYALP